MKGRCSQIVSSPIMMSACEGSKDQSSTGRPSDDSARVTGPTSGSNRKRHIATAITSLTA